MRMRMGRRMNIGAMLGLHDELIFWPLIDQTKSSNRIQIKSGKKNENENGKENAYGNDESLVGLLRGRRGKCPNLPPPRRWLLNASGDEQT